MASRPAAFRNFAPALAFLLSFALVFALAAGARTALAQNAPAAPEREWQLSVAVGPAFALGNAAERWAALIRSGSGGRIGVVTRPGAVLAQNAPAREFAALRDGAAQLAVGSSLAWMAQVPALGAVGLPWIAPDARALAALLAPPVAERFTAAIEAAGAVALAFAPLGHRELATTTRAVRAPADVAGLALRLPGQPLPVDLYAALGARPAAMPFAAAQAALQAGTLDGMDGAPAAFAAARLDAAGVRHVTLWGALAELAVFAVNRAAWDALPAADRELVRAAARTAAAELGARARRDDDAALAELQQRGVTVTRITPAGHTAFAAAAQGVYARWAAVAGADNVRAVEAAVQAAAP